MGLTKHRSQNKNNSKAQYITNPDTLKGIANTIDRVCKDAPEGSVQSFADFKQLVEEGSKSKLGVDICEIDGAVRSFRFYLKAKPNQTTTSRYLAQGTGQDSGEYSPQSVANYFGFAQSVDEVDDELDNLGSQNSSLDSDDNFNDDDTDNDFLEDEDEIESINNRSQNQGIPNSSNKQLNLKASDDIELDDLEEHEFDNDLEEDVLGEDEESVYATIPAKSPYANAVDRLSDEPKVSELPGASDKASYQNDSSGQVLKDASIVAQQAATQGSELNGVNLIGDAATGAVLTAAIVEQLLAGEDNESTNDPTSKRLKALLESYEQIDRRTLKIEEQAQKVEQQIPSPSNDRLERQESDELPSRVSQVVEQFDTFNPRIDGLEDKISKLEKNLGVESDSSTPPQSSLPIFEEGDDIGKRLDKLEAYAKHLDQRLDKFEERLNQLQETIDNLTKNQNSTQNIDSVEVEEQSAQTPDPSMSEKNRSPSGKTPYRTRQRAQVEL